MASPGNEKKPQGGLRFGAGPVEGMTSRSFRQQAALGVGLLSLPISQREKPTQAQARPQVQGEQLWYHEPQVEGSLRRYKEGQGLGFRNAGVAKAGIAPGQHAAFSPRGAAFSAPECSASAQRA